MKIIKKNVSKEEEIRKHNMIGEYLKYPSIAINFIRSDRKLKSEKIRYGQNNAQYILYFPTKLEQDRIKEENRKKHSKIETVTNENNTNKIKKYVIFYIHGGGWREGNAYLYKFVGRRFAKENYHCISLGYRLTTKVKYPSQIEDIYSGFVKGLEILKEKNIDYSNIIIVGSSAGAHLGALLVYHKEMQKKYNIDPNIFKGYVSLGGPINFDVCTNETISEMIEQLFEANYKNRDSANPYSNIDGTEKTKVLCIHSKNDPICESDNAITFTERVNSFNKDLAKCIILENEKIYHTNLVNGIFLEHIDSENVLQNVFKWIDML